MKAQLTREPGVFYLYPHKDPYGLDSLYISPVQEQEIWNLSALDSAEILSLSFLALRISARELLRMQDSEILGVSPRLKQSFLRKKWNVECLPSSWKAVFPSIVAGNLETYFPIADTKEISMRLDWSDGQEEVGFGFPKNPNSLPQILDELVAYSGGERKFYLRLSRQSFFYIPRVGSRLKQTLFIQEKVSYGFPEFYYYWISL